MNIISLHAIPPHLIGGPVNGHIPITQMPTPVRAMPAPAINAQAAPLPSPTGIHLHIAPSSMPGGFR